MAAHSGTDTGLIAAARAETLRVGRMAAVIGIASLAAFHVQDVTLLGFHNLLPWRAVGLFGLSVFLLLSYTLFPRRPELIVRFHALALTSLMVTICGIIFTIAERPDATPWHLANGANALTVNIVAVFIFAAGVRHYLGIVLIGPLSVLAVAFAWRGTLDAAGWASLSNPGILAIAVSAYAHFEARFRRDAYRAQQVTAQQRETIHAQHAMMSTLLDAIDEAAFVIRPDGIIEYGNSVTAKRVGRRWEEFVGENIYDLIPPEVAANRRARIDEVLRTGQALRFIDERAGRAIENAIYPVRDEKGAVVLLVIIGFDITERVLAERRIQSLYQEKTLLLKEVHHRIKNNMATLASMLSLGAAQASAPESVALLTEMRSRITTMMEIYNLLYRTEDYSYIALHLYLQNLVHKIGVASPHGDAVHIEANLEEFEVERRVVFAFGLIVNELVTNALKYAFPAGRSGTITVRVTRTVSEGTDPGLIHLTVADDGVGIKPRMATTMPEEVQPGFGLRLVDVLVNQLQGERQIVSDRTGTTVTVTVPTILSSSA